MAGDLLINDDCQPLGAQFSLDLAVSAVSDWTALTILTAQLTLQRGLFMSFLQSE